MNIQLPDGSSRTLADGATAYDLAADIGAGLARATIAATVNGKQVDVSHVLSDGDTVSLITEKSAEGVEVIRHSMSHLMAMAVQEVFPGAQVTIGPVIEGGFYYDFAYERAFTPEDLSKIEEKMRQLCNQKLPITREEWDRDAAIAHFEGMGEIYKAKLIGRIPAGETVSLYRQGEWSDLCRGPHVPNTGVLKHFKLMKVSGAYWEGNSDNEQLRRIYGTAWASKQDLNDYLHRLEEAEKRDHRKLAKSLDLFHLQEEAPGMIFWHPKGWSVWQVVENEIRSVMNQHGYKEIKTPQVVDRKLWEKSGHWEKFRDDMFTTSTENREYAIKPMNCPCHVQVYNQGLHSYRDLPLRLAEFGSCHRNEPSGTLHGLMRLRNFVQDDAHIFCAESQIESEVLAFIDLVFETYKKFGFEDVIIFLSDRPEQRVGTDEQWDKAESSLHEALKAKGLEYGLNPGEGAFYGPKIEFSLKDCLGRVWQCGTIQVDFSMPGRLGAEYVDEESNKQTPVMLHRAVLGSMERFIGILIEEYEGKFPLWLSPVQAVVCNISDSQREYADSVAKKLQKCGFRVESDLRNEKVGYKVRAHTLQRVPLILVVGDKERDENTVSVRSMSGENIGTFTVDACVEMMKNKVQAYE
ncbi:MAG: threonine--tRNA ligase [Zetaproteobacteria bacterium CG_4_9_14_3_um_filter_49_83]|nr:MAG: threonine--tRNA ligase [Zetaproteobacteria bacterium CG1_02_49_23]PIQ30660.1 MAG: threonine--tRNA ligase [Zetaproteobacteria bacterium CG17_big_fil_post_rev_8_21_14_2_50_50_13]PIV31700.1 MAG: threonine--tRNA ligase [Zetaproteobacteria bacterium CG02_land_8_20_14_3_00_50_9]PIY55123.1 MAG: threonine--tRNA ligase [Zetaproteobacteria bacterium CG_4_10_14_0_8_um_filter_49_80]PJA35300.1 MAG: threonine--tRNA ligase [Zetaproteobacteria bacterium CG_4_9_14_3_um_filter_49_83]